MRNLLSEDYFPFGSQYYRAPSPRQEDWDRDHENMAKLGFNMVKYWVQWRWNHPAEDEFYFDDIDRLMDIAHKHGLKVMLNTIIDVAPAWIYQKYPDASMVTLGGRKIGPQTQAHRQIGGLGLCLNHSDAMEHCFRFLRTTFERYADHPALEIWNVGSEPELTQSMSEMRLWADDASKMTEMICHCPRCEAAFKTWLKDKYGSIDRLNHVWNRNYRSFDEAEVPKTRNQFNDIMDWRMFFVSTLGANVKRRFDVCAEADGDRHAKMCHHVFIQGFPITSTASDPWNVGRYGDLHGFTQMDDAMMSDILRSCARGKPVISAEMLMLYGYTLELPKPIDLNDIKRFIFTGVAANQKGFVFWQYRPETLGREAPAWGLSHLDGSETPWLKHFSDVGNALQEHKDFLFDAEPRPAPVAMIYNPENQIFVWAATGNEKSATDSLLGTHRALYERNHTIDFLHPWDFEKEGLLDRYRVIYAPFSYVINQQMADALKQWVHDGGVLIAESFFAGWYIEEGRHHTTVPGYGLHEVFQARQRMSAPPEGPAGEVEIVVSEKLPFSEKDDVLKGAFAQETFFLEGARALATFRNGDPAVTFAEYGSGKAILIGSYIGLAVHRERSDANARFIASLVEYAAGVAHADVDGDARIRTDILEDGNGGAMLIFQNVEDRPVKAKVTVELEGVKRLKEIFSGASLKLKRSRGRATATLRLEPKEVQAYRA